jgi:hypothetical protein
LVTGIGKPTTPTTLSRSVSTLFVCWSLIDHQQTNSLESGRIKAVGFSMPSEASNKPRRVSQVVWCWCVGRYPRSGPLPHSGERSATASGSSTGSTCRNARRAPDAPDTTTADLCHRARSMRNRMRAAPSANTCSEPDNWHQNWHQRRETARDGTPTVSSVPRRDAVFLW